MKTHTVTVDSNAPLQSAIPFDGSRHLFRMPAHLTPMQQRSLSALAESINKNCFQDPKWIGDETQFILDIVCTFDTAQNLEVELHKMCKAAGGYTFFGLLDGGRPLYMIGCPPRENLKSQPRMKRFMSTCNFRTVLMGAAA